MNTLSQIKGVPWLSRNIHSIPLETLLMASLLVLFFMPYPSSAETIFNENFDNLADQEIEGRCRFEGDLGDPEGSCNSVPQGWDFIYTSDKNSTNPPAEIFSGASKTGKGLRVYDESYGDNNSWGHDIQLAKHFASNQYQELWVSMWIRFNPDADISDLNAAKIFRMGHYNPKVIDGTTGTSIVNTNLDTSEGETTSGLMFYDIKQVTSTIYRHKLSLRGDPDYKMGTQWNGFEIKFRDANGEMANPTWGNTYGDGNWHRFEVGMIMNSSPGAGDGEVRLYFDGIYQGGKTNVPWLQSGHTNGVSGFNMFTLGGNADSVWSGDSNEEQHFYDIDDVEVCTTRCVQPLPPNPVNIE